MAISDKERDVTGGMRQGLTSYGDAGFSLFLRKAFIKAMGYSEDALDRPIVGITNTYSDFNPCHGNVPTLIEAVKRGVMLAGGMPMVFPTISIHESFAFPTSMFLRNLMAMDTEEMIRALPVDSVVLIGGCDKTIPAQVMAAASADKPAIVLPVGPMLVGHFKGEVLGACTDCRRLWGEFRGGRMSEADIETANARLVPSIGTCGVMGTASTIACMMEALGMALPGSATIPATHADRVRIAEASGKRAAELTKGGPKPSEILTKDAFRNAIVMLQAIGGSTNGVVHLSAMAGRTKSAGARGFRRDRKNHAGAGRPEAVGRPLHGAFPPCRRRAAADAGAQGSACARCKARHGRHARRRHQDFRRRAGPDRDQAAQCAAEEGRRACRAARQSRPAAPSSSRRRRRRS